MRGTKRFSGSDSSSVLNDSLFQGKRVCAGRQTDSSRPESSHTRQQQASALPLDLKRAELSRQHVRALNTQFASWVQSQLQNHPDELWQDGAQDYINQASSIMEKFADVVNWLKANVANGETVRLSGSEKQNIVTDSTECMKSETAVNSSTGTIGSLWGFGSQNNVLSDSKGVDKPSSNTLGTTLGSSTSIDENNKFEGVLQSTTGFFGGSWSSGGQKCSENKQIGSTLSSEKTKNSLASTSTSFGGTAASFGVTTPSFGGAAASFGGTTPSFGSSRSSGTSFNNNNLFSFGIQTSIANSQNSISSTNSRANEDEDGEDGAEPQPGSPSVKKTEEKGIMVMHEVKCKLYVKSTDPANGWTDKGVGQLSIKCKEGVTRGTKESKPTIMVRNDVGKLLLNALLYPGIKTNLQKKDVVVIFHSSGDGDDISSVVARTFLIRTKTEEDRDKLDAAIKEYAPTA